MALAYIPSQLSSCDHMARRNTQEVEDIVSYVDSDDETASGESYKTTADQKPQYPAKIGNWQLGECLGSGYSGE